MKNIKSVYHIFLVSLQIQVMFLVPFLNDLCLFDRCFCAKTKKVHVHAYFVLQQLSKSEIRYCPEAVSSVEVVSSCPDSKEAWDIAARRKNCSGMATRQSCSTVEQFKYHCVINGFRDKLVEVCAPERIIFGKVVT